MAQPGTNGLLDVARQTYQEGSQDILAHVENLKGKGALAAKKV